MSFTSYITGAQNISARNLNTMNETVGLSFIVNATGSCIIPWSTGNNSYTASTGSIYYNTTTNKLTLYSGTGWVGVGLT